jgi:hypothetical protein
MIPIHTARQMLDSTLHTELRIAGALVIESHGITPNGVRQSGQAGAVVEVIQLVHLAITASDGFAKWTVRGKPPTIQIHLYPMDTYGKGRTHSRKERMPRKLR